MRRYGFTATREGLAEQQWTTFRSWAGQHTGEFHHGDCVGGDENAHETVRSIRGWRIVVHPGLGPRHLRAFVSEYNVLCPAKPNLERNTDIVNETDELVACPKGPEVLRSGTWSTIRQARALRRPITIIWPDGSVKMENQPAVAREANADTGHRDRSNGGVPGTNQNPPQRMPEGEG